MNSRLLVYLHLYYHEQLPFFLERLSSVDGCNWDLVVSWSEENEESERLLRAFRPDVTILKVANVGYDIWPFIAMLRAVDIRRYDYVLKLHTKNANIVKNRINGLNLRGFRWRNLLVDALLRSRGQFRKVLERLHTDPKVGIACNAALLKRPSVGLAEDTTLLEGELERIGMHPADSRFCAGTMFLARMEPFVKLRDSDLTEESFSGLTTSHNTGTLAHVYERIVFYYVTSAGYGIYPVISHPYSYFMVLCHDLSKPFLHWLFSIECRGAERVKYLRVLGMDFKLKK